MFKSLFSLVLSCLFLQATAQLKWPAVTEQTRPWTRWWWIGSAVNPQDLTWNLEQYKAAGLGGVELTPIYGVYGYEPQFIDFLSPQWMQMLMHTFKESKRLGIGVDLANGTGWPFGGPSVTDEDASKSVYYKTYNVDGGRQVRLQIEYVQEAFVRTANNKPAGIDSILQPVARNKNLQALALDQIKYPGKLPLQLLMAYDEKGGKLDITRYVDTNGYLVWLPPTGKWTLYAVFSGLHGKMVERAAPGGEGYAIDHFSSQAVANYFKRFDEAFKGYDVSYMRAFFNDSYEVDDARGQSNWTPQLLSEFKKRRGYDLRNYLPALFGKADSNMNSRVLYDYRSVIDELLLEYFTVAWKKWATTKGALVRNQSHGSPANTLDLYAAVDIPETEGTDILRYKFATSAANVSGKQLAAAESATWLNEHFLSSWGDVKKLIDLYFLGGVNHIVYHGTAYSPKAAPWPGWLFYAAVHFQPNNPQWKDFKTLNDYITRVQSFLQAGRPHNDILVYYPIVDTYSKTGGDLVQHFDGMERNFIGSDFEHISKWMVDKGYSFDFFSDRQLQKMEMSGNEIVTSGNRYKTILLPGNKLIPEKTFAKLIDLAKKGATIVVYKSMPEGVPGFSQLQERRKLFNMLRSSLQFSGEELKTAKIGKGAFYESHNMESLLSATKAIQEKSFADSLQIIRRKNADGVTYFINNRSNTIFNDWAVLYATSSVKSVALFDPMTGEYGLAAWKPSSGMVRVKMQIPPYASVIVRTYNTKQTGDSFFYYNQTARDNEVKGNWEVEFIDGGPTLPAKRTINTLSSWTMWGGEDFRNFSGSARYTINFPKPAGTNAFWLLQLGKVHETAEVFLNGKKLATLIGPDFQTIFPSTSLLEFNKLEIVVSNLMANRIAHMDRNNLPWKIFYNTNMPARRRENAKNGIFTAAEWQPLPSGLLGPVMLTPLDQAPKEDF
ncbi:MAG TPA: glycosyl hydrolase [Chitinophagaceae bacterium]